MPQLDYMYLPKTDPGSIQNDQREVNIHIYINNIIIINYNPQSEHVTIGENIYRYSPSNVAQIYLAI